MTNIKYVTITDDYDEAKRFHQISSTAKEISSIEAPFGKWNLLNHKENDPIPVIQDDNVLVELENGNIETVHIEDYFRLYGNGADLEDNPVQSRWYLHGEPKPIAWMYLPLPSKLQK